MSTQKIDIDRIVDNRFQARDSYDEIVGLARDIAWNGLLQGLAGRIIDEDGALARHDGEMPAINANRYFDEHPTAQVELVFGHRRLRAIRWMIEKYNSKNIEYWHRGLDKNPDVKQMVTSGKVPVTIRPMSDADMYAAVVSENSKRDDLNAIERARSLHIGRQNRDMTNRELAKVHDRSESWVSNQLRLLRLRDEMQEAVANGKLSTRQAAALVPLYELDDEQEDVVDDVNFPIDLRPPTIEEAALSGASSADLRERVADMQMYIEEELSEEEYQEPEPAEEAQTEMPAPAPGGPAPEAAPPAAPATTPEPESAPQSDEQSARVDASNVEAPESAAPEPQQANVGGRDAADESGEVTYVSPIDGLNRLGTDELNYTWSLHYDSGYYDATLKCFVEGDVAHAINVEDERSAEIALRKILKQGQKYEAQRTQKTGAISRAKEKEQDKPERDTDLCETTLRRLLEHEHIDHYAAKASRQTLIVAWWLAEGERATRIASEIRKESEQSNIALVYTQLPDGKQKQMRELAERSRQDAKTEEATPF